MPIKNKNMKKIILTAVAVFAFGFANAQKAQFGIKGGLNIANQNFSGEEAPSPSSLIEINVGGFVEIKISEKFAIQPELLYSTQGSSFDLDLELDEGFFETSNKFKLSYINIPVMFKYYADKKLSLEAGPQIGFLTSSNLVVKTLGQTLTQDSKALFKSIDFGLNIGAGYDLTKKLSASLRYNFGLANIAETENGDNTKIINSVFSISLGYKL